jgi:hypothetical protein
VVFGALLVLLVLGLALFYGARQVRVLRRPADSSPEEASYERARARRRLCTSLLLLLLGVQLAVTLVFLEEPAHQQGEEWKTLVDEARKRGEPVPERTPEQRWFARVYGWNLIAMLLVLLAVVLLAGLDLWATRRFGIAQHRQIRADRRAMIERQIEQLRSENRGEE